MGLLGLDRIPKHLLFKPLDDPRAPGALLFTRGTIYMDPKLTIMGAFYLYLSGVFDEKILKEIEKEDVATAFCVYYDELQERTTDASELYAIGRTHAECHDILKNKGFFTEAEANGYYNFFFGSTKIENDKDKKNYEEQIKCKYCDEEDQQIRKHNFSFLTSVEWHREKAEEYLKQLKGKIRYRDKVFERLKRLCPIMMKELYDITYNVEEKSEER